MAYFRGLLLSLSLLIFNTASAGLILLDSAPTGFVGTSELIGKALCNGALLGRELTNRNFTSLYHPERVVVVNEATNKVTNWSYLRDTDLRATDFESEVQLLVGAEVRNSEDLKIQSAIHIDKLPTELNELYASVSTGIDRSNGRKIDTFKAYADRAAVAFRLKDGSLVTVDLIGNTDFGRTIDGGNVGVYNSRDFRGVELTYLELNLELISKKLGRVIQFLGADHIEKTYFIRRQVTLNARTNISLLTQKDLEDAKFLQNFFLSLGINKPMELGATPYYLGSDRHIFRKQLPVPDIVQAYEDRSN